MTKVDETDTRSCRLSYGPEKSSDLTSLKVEPAGLEPATSESKIHVVPPAFIRYQSLRKRNSTRFQRSKSNRRGDQDSTRCNMGKCNPVGIRRDDSFHSRITHAGDEVGESRARDESLRLRHGGFRGPLEHVLPTGIRRRMFLRLFRLFDRVLRWRARFIAGPPTSNALR